MTPEIDHQHGNVTLRESARQAAELAAMRRMIQASSECFSLSVAVCNSPALRDFLISRLKETFPRIAVVEVPRGTTDVFGYVEDRQVGDDAAALFLTNLEASISTKEEQDQPTLRSLNASRELWERAFRCPMVIWAPEWAATALARHAKDLWRYRSHRFEFVSEQASADAGVSDAFSGDLAGASNLSLEEKQFRLAELEQRLADWGDDPSSDLLPHALTWLNEAAFLRAVTGDLDGAETTFRKSLAIKEKLGRVEGMAGDYSNLGIVLKTRGDLDGAEAMYRKSLKIDEKLGRLEGMANQYGNLGIMLKTRGDLDGAEAMYRKSLEINEKLGSLEGMASQYGNLGSVLLERGDLDGAEAMHRKSLEINEKLGRLEGMANQYGNLGIVSETRGDLNGAREQWTKAVDLFQRIGMPHMVERVRKWLDAIGDIRTEDTGSES